MATGAAFFDLDRTLLAGASGPIITEALRTLGVVSDRPIPGENLVYKVFDTVGETLPAMFITRQAARVAKGWDRATVQRAGEHAAERLVDLVQPFGRLLVERHREEGRPVVLATTSPYDLVRPLAERLGLDDVIATRYGEAGGAYDGTIAGEFVWGPGKLAAVRAWAGRRGIDLADSWAYSDSLFDVPLLSAVGHPVAVNPDLRLRAVATLRRWPQQHLDVPAGVPKFAGLEPQRALQHVLRPEILPFVRWDIAGLEHLPHDGPVILTANHRSYFDPLAIGYATGRAGRVVRFLGKREVFDAPVVGQLATALGGIRVDRGSGSDVPLDLAADALAGGQVVAILPQGTIPRGEAFFEPVLEGRWGAARLAARTGVAVVPCGLWGTEEVWPRSARVPNITNVFNPPTVRIRFGPPVELKGKSPKADTARIMDAITALLPAEARERRTPTADELSRALPPH